MDLQENPIGSLVSLAVSRLSACETNSYKEVVQKLKFLNNYKMEEE